MAIRDELEVEKKTEDENETDSMLKGEEITEDIIWAGCQKIKTIYERADENNEVVFCLLK